MREASVSFMQKLTAHIPAGINPDKNGFYGIDTTHTAKVAQTLAFYNVAKIVYISNGWKIRAAPYKKIATQADALIQQFKLIDTDSFHLAIATWSFLTAMIQDNVFDQAQAFKEKKETLQLQICHYYSTQLAEIMAALQDRQTPLSIQHLQHFEQQAKLISLLPAELLKDPGITLFYQHTLKKLASYQAVSPSALPTTPQTPHYKLARNLITVDTAKARESSQPTTPTGLTEQAGSGLGQGHASPRFFAAPKQVISLAARTLAASPYSDYGEGEENFYTPQPAPSPEPTEAPIHPPKLNFTPPTQTTISLSNIPPAQYPSSPAPPSRPIARTAWGMSNHQRSLFATQIQTLQRLLQHPNLAPVIALAAKEVLTATLAVSNLPSPKTALLTQVLPATIGLINNQTPLALSNYNSLIMEMNKYARHRKLAAAMLGLLGAVIGLALVVAAVLGILDAAGAPTTISAWMGSSSISIIVSSLISIAAALATTTVVIVGRNSWKTAQAAELISQKMQAINTLLASEPVPALAHIPSSLSVTKDQETASEERKFIQPVTYTRGFS